MTARRKPPARSRTRSASPEKLRGRARTLLGRLRKQFPGARTALLHETPFELLVSTILSAQCTDERVNKVTPELFGKYATAKDLASADQAVLEQEIRSTGFYRMKAKNIIACSKALVERHGGVVPHTMDELVRLPGVGRKTANVVLGQAFGIASGVVVDTHVQRLSQRLGFSSSDDPVKIEDDLMAIFPRGSWIELGSILILHGRSTCNARKPRCQECVVGDMCPSAETFLKKMK